MPNNMTQWIVPIERIPKRGLMVVFTQPFHYKQDVTQGQFFKQSSIGLNSNFSFS